MPCVRFHTSPDYGSVGCTIGLTSDLYVGAFGEDSADALSKAASVAAKLQSTIDKNPALATALSIVPGGAVALRAISLASNAIKTGKSIAQVADSLGPGIAKVTSKLLNLF